MDRLRHIFFDEWERHLLLMVLFLLLGLLLMLAWCSFTEKEGKTSSNSPIPRMPSFFDLGQADYLGAPKVAVESANPFAFAKPVPAPPPPKATPPKATDTGKKQQPPAVPPKTETKTSPPKAEPPKKVEPPKKAEPPKKVEPPKKNPPPKPAPPPKPPRKVVVSYRGYIGAESRKVAFYSASDSQGPRREAKAANPGARILGLLEIKDFTPNELRIVQNGKFIIIPKGKQHEFIISESK